MKVIILGCGVIGVVSAYYLRKEGHEVEIIDQHAEAGLETSFANAGQISFGFSSPWAAPGMVQKAIGWMLHKHSPLVVKPHMDPFMARWLWRMVLNCTPEAYAINKSRMVRLSSFSRECLADIRNNEALEYDGQQKGTLQMFRTQKMLDAAAKDIDVLNEHGVANKILDREGCLKVEPGLAAVAEKVAGGLHLPDDETGDCKMFTQGLAKICEDMDVKFHYNTKIKKLRNSDGIVSCVITNKGEFAADAYVVALGSHTPKLVRSHGVRTRIYPVKGYSVTLPITDESEAPTSTIMDEKNKVAITRLGNRIRAAGTAELTGYNAKLTHSRCDMLFHVVQDLFPNGGDLTKVQFWTGLRPMIPDGPPLIGKTEVKNLYLNSGHGTLGWTMAAGSGKLLSDVISEKEPSISMEGLELKRYN